MSFERPPSAHCRAISCLLAVTALAAFAGCAAEAKPVVSDAPQFRPAGDDDDAPAVAAADSNGSEAKSAFGGGQQATASAAPHVTGRGVEAPNGTLEQLVAQFNELGRREPQGKTPQEQLEQFVATQEQRLAIGNKALSMEPDPQTKEQLIIGMYAIYRTYHRFQVPGAAEQLNAFGKSLAANKDPVVARFGRHILFDFRVTTIASQPLDSGKEIVDEIAKLLEAEKGSLSQETLTAAAQTVEGVLLAKGLQKDAVAALNMMADIAAHQEDLAEQAAQLRDQATLVEADFGTLLPNVITGERDADAKLMAAIKQVLSRVQPSRQTFAEMQQLVRILEVTGHLQAAAEAYDAIEATFANISDAELLELVKRSGTDLRKRVALVGQPFTVEGLTLEGQPFDWSAYQGKVVLIDFWATWCQPCLAEIPNIEQNYKQFRSKGFEVVGVNLNTDIAEVQQFFALQSLPWPSVVSQEVLDGKADMNDFSKLPMAEKCGVDAIPFLVLVGADGKVDSIHVRGDKLKTRLTQLLGEPEKAQVPVDPTLTPTADAAAPAPPAGLVPADEAAPAGSPQINDRGQSHLPVGVPAEMSLLASALFAADATADVASNEKINPYVAKPGLSTAQLVAFVEKMLDKPQTIQKRPGFGAAVVEACDRILAADPPASEGEQLFAIETKLTALHGLACDDDEVADDQLAVFVASLKDDRRPRVERQLKFYALERRVLDSGDLPLDNVPPLLDEVQAYLAGQKLSSQHLRLASATVALINRLEDGDAREKHFAAFGSTFAKSSDKELAAYGRKLAKKPAAEQSGLVGKPLELSGTTSGGEPFDWNNYRGKVVLVDFWATWCGPCRKAMPEVKALYEKFHVRGLEVVGVSLDENQEALGAYLEEESIPWTTLAGEATQDIASKYGVRTIPTMMLVDRQGNIVAVSHNITALAPLAEKQLQAAEASE